MKIVRPGDGSLVIQVRPGIVGYLLGFAMLLPLWILLLEGGIARDQIVGVLAASLISGFFLAYIAEIADFTFDPAGNQLRWSRKTLCNWLTRTEVPFQGQVPLGDISEVNVVSHRAAGKDYDVHRVVLTVPSGPLPLTRFSQTGRGHSEDVALAIRRFLNERGFHHSI